MAANSTDSLDSEMEKLNSEAKALGTTLENLEAD
jgi:hypothetical protein